MTIENGNRRTNKELEELYNVPSIMQFINQQPIRWLGHVKMVRETK